MNNFKQAYLYGLEGVFIGRHEIFKLELAREDAWNSYMLAVSARDKARDNVATLTMMAETNNWHNYEDAAKVASAKWVEFIAASTALSDANHANNVAWEAFTDNSNIVPLKEVN